MDKRYQVFISSTFQDLQNARQEVSQALLRADCFPAGMELFPAADEEQFEFIKTVIDQSDYYIIISAGRYGSIHPGTGLSYTEMEYDYAVEIGKPVIRLLHKDPFNQLKGSHIERTDKGKELLEDFRTKMMTKPQRMVKFWSNESELGYAVDHSLRHLIKTRPAVGWVKSDDANKDLEIENFRLKEKLRRQSEKANERTIEDRLKLNLPIVDACLRKAGIGGLASEEVRIWIPLEEAFNVQGTADENFLAGMFHEHGSVDDDTARTLIDALLLDGLLVVTGNHYKLSKVGQETLRKLRVKSFLMEP